MKVTNILSSYNIYTNKPAISGKKTTVEEKKDNVAVSNKARDFQTALKAVMSSTDIMEDKIDTIKSQIDNGTYFVSTDDIADKILSQSKENNLG